jgi:hypothetical protein
MHLGKLTGNYLHNISAHSDAELEQKHRHYARQEAESFFSRPREAKPLVLRLLSTEALVRRRALKAISQRLPARGVLRFLYQYGWRRGFLDGRAGLSYCILMARYEHWIATEIRALRNRTSPA